MVKRKTSIYVDEELWRRMRKLASERGFEVSSLLEELMREEVGESVEIALKDLTESFTYELDFEPLRPRGPVSELVREMRDQIVYLDSSAIIKRYVSETGSERVRDL